MAMGFYRRIDTRMHGDKIYRSLSGPQPNAKSLFEWLIHGPRSNSIGLYEAGLAGMAELLGWPVEQFQERFAELLSSGMVRWCQEHRVVFLPNFLKHNMPDNINVLKSCLKVLDSLPECHLQGEWIRRFKLLREQLGIPLGERLV